MFTTGARGLLSVFEVALATDFISALVFSFFVGFCAAFTSLTLFLSAGNFLSAFLLGFFTTILGFAFAVFLDTVFPAALRAAGFKACFFFKAVLAIVYLNSYRFALVIKT
ncbi:MAG: hypothetical protein L6Q57_05540 [Alphaproteobacteria bacterium]|nr:hypothetical protein [Alphaproteobacteria bacterium]